jgi:hypothetical protein
MKNLILTTVSVLALSAFAVQADPTNMNDQISQPNNSQLSTLATDGSSTAPSAAAPSASTGSSSGQMMETHPSTTATAPAAPSANSNAVPSHMVKQHGPQQAAPKHHAKRHGKHHGKHHASAGHPQYPNEAEIGGVFVTFPPMDLNLCKPQNFCGKPECPYVSYEGYFWYPEARQNLLAGYTPAQLRGMYWYPSHTHPHMVYATKTRAVYTHPYVLNRPYPMDGAMYTAQEFPMEKKWESAPDMKPGQAN